MYGSQLDDIANQQGTSLPRLDAHAVDERSARTIEVAQEQSLSGTFELRLLRRHPFGCGAFLVGQVDSGLAAERVAEDELTVAEGIHAPRVLAADDFQSPTCR